VADRLVERLPCPEHRVSRARVLAATGNPGAAYREVGDVEGGGYRSRRTLGLRADLSFRLRFIREHADATAAYFERYGGGHAAALAAGSANYFAGDFGWVASLF